MKEISKYKEIDICDYQNLKNGKDYTLTDGKIIPNKDLTIDPAEPLRYGYCSDTEYHEEIIPLIENIDLLYHEATFLEEHRDLAEKTKHSTAYQAAQIAHKAKVKRLLLGHYSSRYTSLDLFLEEASILFKNTELAEAGNHIHLSN